MKTFRLVQLNVNSMAQEERLASLKEAFEFSKADFLTLQEVNQEGKLRDLLKESFPYAAASYFKNKRAQDECVMVFSKHPLKKLRAPAGLEPELAERLVGVSAQLFNETLNIFSCHFAWGGEKEPSRLRQAEYLDSWASSQERRNPNAISLFGGDLNAEPGYRSIRFLTGQDLDHMNTRGTFWTDAWSAVGSKENEITNDHGSNEQGARTARGVGIAHPEFLPARRIDYLMSRGWRYGKVGGPLTFTYLKHPRGLELSDHNGIMVDFIGEV